MTDGGSGDVGGPDGSGIDSTGLKSTGLVEGLVEIERDVPHIGERGAWLAATLPALDLALGSVQAFRRAAADAGATGPLVDDPLNPARVAAAFASDRLLRLDGHPVVSFAELSGFFPTGDGWVRTHANYPHHHRHLVRLLGVHEAAARPDLEACLSSWSAQELEDRATEANAVAVRVRTEQEWRDSPMGEAAWEGPLVRIASRTRSGGTASPLTALPGTASARSALRHGSRGLLAGVRVLDLTRVIAGPVATRALALLGADVLRIDPPVPAEIRWQHLDTGHGKHTALLDLNDRGDLARAQDLLDDADVLVTGYRPGAVERFGLRTPDHVVHARISAWGTTGPWAGRRGFDSIVQAATGIAVIESSGETPGVLPAQVIDHATGYLLAAGIVRALTARDGVRAAGAQRPLSGDGLGRDVSASLVRTAGWLLDEPGRDPLHPPAARPHGTVTHGGMHAVSERRKPGGLGEEALGGWREPGSSWGLGRREPAVTSARPALPVDDYPAPAHPWGSDHACWPKP